MTHQSNPVLASRFRWTVEVTGGVGVRPILREVLAHLDSQFEESETRAWIAGPAIEPSDTAEAARARVDEILNAVALAGAGTHTLALGAVVLERCEGRIRRRHFMTLEATAVATATMTATLSVGALSPADREAARRSALERERQERARRVGARALTCLRNPVAAKVQRYLREPLTVQRMNAIVELIENALQGDLGKLELKRQHARFTASINHPRVLGDDARHAVTNRQPPPNPMSLAECETFVRRLGERWLEHLDGSYHKSKAYECADDREERGNETPY